MDRFSLIFIVLVEYQICCSIVIQLPSNLHTYYAFLLIINLEKNAFTKLKENIHFKSAKIL